MRAHGGHVDAANVAEGLAAGLPSQHSILSSAAHQAQHITPSAQQLSTHMPKGALCTASAAEADTCALILIPRGMRQQQNLMCEAHLSTPCQRLLRLPESRAFALSGPQNDERQQWPAAAPDWTRCSSSPECSAGPATYGSAVSNRLQLGAGNEVLQMYGKVHHAEPAQL